MTREQLARALSAQQPGLKSPLDALNDREMEIFSILSQGYSASQIQSEFGIAPRQLKTLKAGIQRKLGLKTEVQLLQAAARHARGGA